MNSELLAVLIFIGILFIITCITSIYEVRAYRKNTKDIDDSFSKDKSVQ